MSNYSFCFTGEEVGIMFRSLYERPYKEVAPIIDSMNMQIRAAQEEEQRRTEGEKEEMVHKMDHMFNGDKEGDKEE